MIKKQGVKKINLFRLTLFFIVSPLLFYAQIQRLSFHHLTTDDGLSQASNDFIYHDSFGFVWLSSLDGLNRFDGETVKVYKSISGDATSLLGNIITSNFFEDKNNNLWFTTYEGLHCYIREQDHFQHFQLSNSSGEIQKQDYHAFYLDTQDQVWLRVGIGGKGALHTFDINQYKDTFLCSIDGQRNHAVTNEQGAVKQIISYRFDQRNGIELLQIEPSFSKTSYLHENKEGIPWSRVEYITTSSKKKWYLSTDKGLLIFYPEKKEFKLLTTFKNLPLGQIYASERINDSIVCVATSQQDVLFFNEKTEQFISKTPHEPEQKLGLHLSSVRTIYKDRVNNLWLSSVASGVNYTSLDKRKFALPNEFFNRNIVSIFESSRGELFCSISGDSATYFSSATAHVKSIAIDVPKEIGQLPIKDFFEDEKGRIWAVYLNVLLKWNPEKFQFEYVQKSPSYILSVYQSQTKGVLLSTYAGVFQAKISDDEVLFTPFEALKEFQTSLATAIYEDAKGRLYFALDASKLLILQADGDYYQEIRQIESIGYAKDFYEEKNALWVAASTGVLKVNINDLSVDILNEQEDGLPNETYYSIIPDEQNNFWLSSNKGIIRYNRTTLSYRRYTLADGLQGNEYNTNAFLKTQTGEIWMGGTDGLNRFFPEAIENIPYPAKVQLTRLQINDEPAPDSIQIEMIEELTLAHNDNTISFDFTAIDYSDPEHTKLQYQLENNEEEWVDAENNGFARYSNLRHGSYVFKVKGANSDGVWSEEIRQLKIHIKTPWYKTWWFYLLGILATTATVYGIFMYRLQQSLKIERMRVKISSDLHDDVGGLLSGLAMQSELLEMTAAEERKPKLQRISELSRSAMSRMRDTVWAIDARKDKLENLLDRIREHAAETLTPNDIAFDLGIEALALNKNIPVNIRQNLYLICKEAITNAAKHSNGDQMKIQFKKQGRSGILLTIHDNGKVALKNHKTTGLGMNNMQMRAEQIGGSMETTIADGFLIKIIIK